MDLCLSRKNISLPPAIAGIIRKIQQGLSLLFTKNMDATGSGKTGTEKTYAGKAGAASDNGASSMHGVENVLDRYGNAILRLAYSYLHNMSDAEDILQDTLIKYMENAEKLESEEHKKAWLLSVAANLSKNKIDYNRVRTAEDLDEFEETLSSEGRDDLTFVWEAVKTLPEKQREVVHLFYHEGYQSKDISRILGRNESSVRSDLKRGREKLKEILKEAYDFEI